MKDKIITAQEVNELVSRGIPAWEQLASSTLIPIPELRRLVETGELDYNPTAVAVFRGMVQVSNIQNVHNK